MEQESSLRKGDKAEKLSQEQFYENQLFPGGFVTGQGLQPPPRDCPVLPALFPHGWKCFTPLQPDGEFGKLSPSAAFLGSSQTQQLLIHRAVTTGQQRFSPVTPALWGRDETFVSGQIRLQSQLPVELWEKLCSKRTCEFNVNSLPHSNTSKPKLSQGALQHFLPESS